MASAGVLYTNRFRGAGPYEVAPYLRREERLP
jgi:hypothetical protein